MFQGKAKPKRGFYIFILQKYFSNTNNLKCFQGQEAGCVFIKKYFWNVFMDILKNIVEGLPSLALFELFSVSLQKKKGDFEDFLRTKGFLRKKALY